MAYEIDFQNPGRIYFVGIGGISMSGLADILHDAGFSISGSDLRPSAITAALEAKGIEVYYGQKQSHIPEDIDCVVLTSAIREDNPERQAVERLGLPSLSRAQLLGQIMRNYTMPIAVAGTHGKTTTTSMVSDILMEAGLDPTLSIGGILKSIGGNIRVGKSPYFVTEACEYTNSFLSFAPKAGLILNIEEDHMDYFRDIVHIRSSFRRFASLLPEDGVLIINGDTPALEEVTASLPCQVITFGMGADNAYTPKQLQYDQEAAPSFLLEAPGRPPRSFRLRVPGAHNVQNALAAIALADWLGVEDESIARALAAFQGTDRRFEFKGEIGDVRIIDDYAHHPTEIRAALTAARGLHHRRLVCVFQPHTYTRTQAFLGEFAQALRLADLVVLTDIYAAREQNTVGISSQDLQREICTLGGECHYFPSFGEAEDFLLLHCQPGDVLMTMGAGDVHIIGEDLLGPQT